MLWKTEMCYEKLQNFITFEHLRVIYLVLQFVDGLVDARDERFPADTQRFHRVLRFSILEHEVLLHFLVDSLELVQIRLVRQSILMDSTQLVNGIFESASSSESNGKNLLEFLLQPWTNLIGALGKDCSKPFVI